MQRVIQNVFGVVFAFVFCAMFYYVEQKGNRGDRRCRVRWIGKKVSGTRCPVVRNVLTGKNIEIKIYGEDYDTRN